MNSIAQDMVYSVSNGNIKAPKSVLFPTVVKSLCNNTEIVRLINHYRHGISYSLLKRLKPSKHYKLLANKKKNGSSFQIT